MLRHRLDRGSTSRPARLDRAIAMQKSAAPQRATLMLQRRPTHRSAAARLKRFLRIEKGVRV